MFVSLDVDAAQGALRDEVEQAVDGLRAEFQGKGVEVEDGRWGYRLVVVRDPDGNELYFAYPGGEAASTEGA